ncbi:uncharacterized metal-binding protein YceD (DUF177 family) [Mucilaginibacter gracilis]|uniref:Uncharacterized metal-binding protein YceD (DUF177 family) n=1 Tax=Mucilaginibacter gracilis TaxID=423350 RepID=A0A495ITT0_9SPHI|nr:uncharacterized metal-binding protein YceD (DUF177 family) [Mucilaginibacter gracilis]
MLFFLNLRANYRSLKSLKPYSIPYTGLKLGKHSFDFEITKAFFDEFEYSLVKSGKLNCRVELDKQETMIILDFKISGTIDMGCDRCLAEYPQVIETGERAIAKFGEVEIGDDEVDIITLSKNDHEINVAGLIYEYINVAVPFVAVCGYEGKTQYCDIEMLDQLDKLASGEEPPSEDADPRWDALKKIK